MKSIYTLALLVLAANVAKADGGDLSYVCVSSSDATSSALVMTDSTSLNFFVQNYRKTSPINLVGSGTLDPSASTAAHLEFSGLVDWDGNPLAATDAQSIEVTVSGATVTSIQLVRTGALGVSQKLTYNQNCQVDDGSN